MYFNRRAKIIIFLSFIFSVLLSIYGVHILAGVQELTKQKLLFFAILLMVLGIIQGAAIISNSELKESENHLIKIMLLINPCLLGLSMSLAILSYLYIHKNFDIMDMWVMSSLLCVPLSYIIGIFWVIRKRKVKK